MSGKRLTASDKKSRASALLWAELLFLFLPLLIISIIFWNKETFEQILYLPEWSFAASILNGQTIVKFVSGQIVGSQKIPWEKVSLVIASLIVILLVPSLLILSLILLSTTQSFGLAISQLILLFISMIAYLVFGSVGQENLMEEDVETTKQN